jgi:hypothetical protein
MDGTKITGNHALTVGSSHFRRIGTDDAVLTKHLKEQIGAVVMEASLKDNMTSSSMAASLTVGGALVEVSAKSKIEDTKLARAELVGGVLMSKSGKETSASAKGRSTTIGGALLVSAQKALKVDGGLKLLADAALGSFTHPTHITLKVGGSSVVLGDGVVSIVAPSKIVVSVSGSNTLASKESTQA